MESSNIAILMSTWQDKIPNENALVVQQALESVPDDKVGALGCITLKSPIIGLVLGWFFGFFGADRFYKGDIGLGITKLIVSFVTLFTIGAIWVLIDYFLVWKGIKRDNFSKIMQNIQYAK